MAVGLRLLGGHLSLATALFVLILAPEAYLPLRLLGTNYHASAEGMKAAEDVFERAGAPLPQRGTGRRRPRPVAIRASGSTGSRSATRAGAIPALAGAASTVDPGEVVAVAGPSGCGKSTLLGVLLGLRRPGTGAVRVGGVEPGRPGPRRLAGRLAWVPQRPHLFARSIADNVRLGRPDATDAGRARPRIEEAGLDDVVARACPTGLDTGWATAAPGSRRASASGWRWPGPSSGTPRSCCSTSRRPTSTAGPRTTCWTPCGG